DLVEQECRVDIDVEGTGCTLVTVRQCGDVEASDGTLLHTAEIERQGVAGVNGTPQQAQVPFRSGKVQDHLAETGCEIGRRIRTIAGVAEQGAIVVRQVRCCVQTTGGACDC